MELFNLLAETITIWGETYSVYLNGIGKAIRWLIDIVGNVGVGIIVFSLLLKIIVLPFDVYQRISMRKQNVKMKENKEKMEKLQKQYANDKEKYNQKVMEMYRESGISMFSSCLPMILSIVIFMIAIGAFNAYSQYAGVENYNMMVKAYDAKLESYCPDVNQDTLSVDGDKLVVKADGNYIYYTVANNANYAENDYAYVKTAEKTYYVNSDVIYATEKTAVDEILARKNEDGTAVFNTVDEACKRYLIEQAQVAVEVAYEEEISEKTKFLWIKNIWATDAVYKHPVLNHTDFKTGAQSEDFEINGKKADFNDLPLVYHETAYNEITANLAKEKAEPNGFFILIALSIGTILLQQWITMRSQKEQSQYSTVDGQGAQQQKMTMIIMTVMFAGFSFMYSSAFSIYMIISSITSLISTMIINKLVDRHLEKKEEEALQAKYNNRFPGRQYKGNQNTNKK